MAFSFTFNSIDMSSYGLTVTGHEVPIAMEADAVQLPERSYAFPSKRGEVQIVLNVSVIATAAATLLTYMDTIRQALSIRTDANLLLTRYTDRYWVCRFVSLNGSYVSSLLWQGTMVFACHDPLAYGVTEHTDHTYSINASPKTIDEEVAGTGYVLPVYTLTAKNTLTGATIKVENITTSEELVWVGDLAVDGTLVIDVANWIVKKGAIASMATMTGTFPRLKPAVTNQIKVTGLYVSAAGILNITYRDRYI
jgi:hypothetical protein